MSKQSEAKIGVETTLMVCFSKNDSPMKMKRRKVILKFDLSKIGPAVLASPNARIILIFCKAD